MKTASCPVEETAPQSEGQIEKTERMVLNNIAVEALAIFLAGAALTIAKAIDLIFHTKLRHAFISWVHGVSRDRLNVLRRAHVKYVFKRHYHLKKVRIRLAGGSYWLSIPCIVSGIDRKTHTRARYLAKIVNDRSVIKHHYITALRNLGVLAEGASLKFEDYEDPRDMACFERGNLMKLREHGVRVPDVYGIHRLGGDDYMIVMEFIEGKPLSGVPMDEDMVGQVFRALRTIHGHGMFHGDVKLDNFMCSSGEIVVFDSLRIGPGELRDALAFDLACAICALVQKAPLSMVLNEAKKYYSDNDISDAGRMLDIALNRADLELPENKIKEVRLALGG
jgi:hypothetical protein